MIHMIQELFGQTLRGRVCLTGNNLSSGTGYNPTLGLGIGAFAPCHAAGSGRQILGNQKMKKLAIALTAIAAFTAPAFAADMPVRTPVSVPAPVAYAPSWTGCYVGGGGGYGLWNQENTGLDRKSTRLNSSHLGISYAVFCLKKKKDHTVKRTTFCKCMICSDYRITGESRVAPEIEFLYYGFEINYQSR